MFTGSTMNGTSGASSPAFTAPSQPGCEISHGDLRPSTLCQDSFTMTSRFMVAAVCALVPLTCVAQAGINGEASYLSFSAPGALGTFPMSVNNAMTVTGYYYASSTVARGFVRDVDGTLTTFDVAGSIWTEPEGVNDAGEITGYYLENVQGTATPLGFFRDANGLITKFNPPCDPICASLPAGINEFGEIAGSYPHDTNISAGFSRTREGKFTSYWEEFGDNEDDAVVTAINGSGTVTGFYQPANTPQLESFIEDARGYFIAGIYVPAANSNAPYALSENTVAEGINAEGTIVGWYTGCFVDPCFDSGSQYIQGGFVRSAQGEFTLFNPPGNIVTFTRPGMASSLGGTAFFQSAPLRITPHRLSINQSGSVTGSYNDAVTGALHGFVRNPYGTLTTFDPPMGGQTTATSINDSGVITGNFTPDWAAPAQGFLRIPQPPQ
jgi:uncharacterized membrane protein